MAPASRQHPPENTKKIIPFFGQLAHPRSRAAAPQRTRGRPRSGCISKGQCWAAARRGAARLSADPPRSAQTFALCRRWRRRGGSSRVTAQCRRRPAGGSTEQRRGPRSPQGAPVLPLRAGGAVARCAAGGGGLVKPYLARRTRQALSPAVAPGKPCRPRAPCLRPHASSRSPSSAAARPCATYPSEGAPAPPVAAATSAEHSGRQRNWPQWRPSAHWSALRCRSRRRRRVELYSSVLRAAAVAQARCAPRSDVVGTPEGRARHCGATSSCVGECRSQHHRLPWVVGDFHLVSSPPAMRAAWC